ncbi:MAG: glucose-1-phosphate adenylyltransferase [Candidatus Tectomicrobia bacterium]|uniref:Glucose-1-phosphate adenylyltransferase n=1 Tax=Tectimicrobiota bacterium TaxID=2528274 RepID=A0A933LRH8_UNCTE|nr:glucose-1-phosphate adenylyltransferase [Candidatus Tectomicrobia bacterium]
MKVLGIIMAGGVGSRLYPLTKDRAKPAVPFGGKYRIIDFVLSNFVNSSIYSIYVITQFKSQSLMEHLQDGWRFGSIQKDHFIVPVPAQMRSNDSWYRGTADAIYQNIYLIERFKPEVVAIFGADHIYRMDIRQMIEYHLRKRADFTLAAVPILSNKANEFGVIQIDHDWRMIDYQEKPGNPKGMPDQPDFSLISMGNYIFSTDFLLKVLEQDAATESDHDLAKDVLPSIFDHCRAYVYDFRKNTIPGTLKGERNDYWRDVGTIQAYWEANMDLRAIQPALNLYNNEWPIRNAIYNDPPAKFAFNEYGRRGQALDSVVSGGCIISGGLVLNSVLGRDVFIHSFSEVFESILMDNVDIGRHAKIKRAIIDKNVKVPEGTVIGYDPEADGKGFFVDESGLVVIPKNYKF